MSNLNIKHNKKKEIIENDKMDKLFTFHDKINYNEFLYFTGFLLLRVNSLYISIILKIDIFKYSKKKNLK